MMVLSSAGTTRLGKIWKSTDKMERLTITDSYPSNAPMPLQTEETSLFCSSQPLLLDLGVTTGDAETQVHATPDAGTGHDVVHLGMLLENAVQQLGLGRGHLFNPGNLLVAVGRQQQPHHLAGNPDVEDGKGVVERVVLSDDAVVENHGRYRKAELTKQFGGRRGRLGR